MGNVLRRIERIQTAMRSNQEYSSNRWKPWMKKSMPVNHRKKVRSMPLYGLVGSFRGKGSLVR